MRRVFFVGIHNKPGKSPLDSSTQTGKFIDGIISLIDKEKAECVKTNLCEKERAAIDREIPALNKAWIIKYKPRMGDIIILLGLWTQTNFKRSGMYNYVFATHPAGAYGSAKTLLKNNILESVNWILTGKNDERKT